MNLGPDAHYNPVTGTFMRSSQLDPYRMLYKPNTSATARPPSPFTTNRILANAPILSVADLKKIKQPSSRAKYLCRKLSELYGPRAGEASQAKPSSIQILSMEQKIVTRNPVDEESSAEQESEEDPQEVRNQISRMNVVNAMYEYSEVTDSRQRDFDEMSETHKDTLTCDEVFCMYLREICKNVNERWYKQCLRFVLLYRECINEFGWLKRSETYARAGMLNEDTLLQKLRQQEEAQDKGKDEAEDKDEQEEIYIPQAEYSAVCNADFLPMICNDFVTDFLDQDHGACTLERSEAIDLTRNFCHWIAINGLTCARVTLY